MEKHAHPHNNTDEHAFVLRAVPDVAPGPAEPSGVPSERAATYAIQADELASMVERAMRILPAVARLLPVVATSLGELNGELDDLSERLRELETDNAELTRALEVSEDSVADLAYDLARLSTGGDLR